MESRRNSSGTSSQDFATQRRSQKFIEQIRRNTRNFHKKNSIHVNVKRHLPWNKKQWTRMFGTRSTRIFVCRKIWWRTKVIHWSWLWEKWYSMKEDSPQRMWDNLAEKMIEFAESGCPIFRATNPLSRGHFKSKGHGKLSIHFAVVQETIETIFHMIVSANQLSFHGVVAEMCEEYETLQDKSGRPDAVMGINCAQCDQDRSFFGEWWSRKILYECMISECFAEWTVFHDERHWRYDTIQYNDLS